MIGTLEQLSCEDGRAAAQDIGEKGGHNSFEGRMAIKCVNNQIIIGGVAYSKGQKFSA